MQFVRIGEFPAASRITGPRHNLLKIPCRREAQAAVVCEALPPVGNCRHAPLNEAELIAFVMEGVKKANAELCTHRSATHIQYVQNDTKPETVYAFLAHAILTHLESGGVFDEGGSTNAL